MQQVDEIATKHLAELWTKENMLYAGTMPKSNKCSISADA